MSSHSCRQPFSQHTRRSLGWPVIQVHQPADLILMDTINDTCIKLMTIDGGGGLGWRMNRRTDTRNGQKRVMKQSINQPINQLVNQHTWTELIVRSINQQFKLPNNQSVNNGSFCEEMITYRYSPTTQVRWSSNLNSTDMYRISPTIWWSTYPFETSMVSGWIRLMSLMLNDVDWSNAWLSQNTDKPSNCELIDCHVYSWWISFSSYAEIELDRLSEQHQSMWCYWGIVRFQFIDQSPIRYAAALFDSLDWKMMG